MLINNEHIDEQALAANLENFIFLREKALQYIQQSASQTWTDHNLHDPGITIMEALCYALSDVGFRLNFPMHDLLADKDGHLPSDSFYKPQDIFPSHAVTIRDFRKLLLDIPSVKNAWVCPLLSDADKIPPDYEAMYVYPKESTLLTEKDVLKLPLTQAEKDAILKNKKIFILGLYAIQIEFETDALHGAIDSGEHAEPVYDKTYFGELYYDIGNWQDLLNDLHTLQHIASVHDNDTQSITLEFDISPKNKFNNADGQLHTRLLSEWHLDIRVFCNGQHAFTFIDVVFVPYFENKKGILINDLLSILSASHFTFFATCFSKISALHKAYSSIRKTLYSNRNLCEDFLPQLSAIPSIDFRICMDIDVASDADIEQVQAEIFYAVEQYITPSVQFYSHKQMLDKGFATEELFEGPRLQHGFLIDSELGEDSFTDYTINLSDIVNAIYEIEGLQNCRNINLFLVDKEGHKLINSNEWTIDVPSGFKPVLNKRKCKLLFYKNELPLLPNFGESLVKLSILHANRFKQVDTSLIEPSFNAVNRDLAIHYSLANDFPATYKIGKYFPDTYLNDASLYPSKQLEGYLLLFEQMIADFLQDLDQLKETLSWKDTVKHINHSSSINEWRRDYLLNKPVDVLWQNITEPESEFLKKRNDTLDFLLSRFAEDLHELDNFFYLSTDNLGIDRNDYLQSLIELKQNFLANYIAISSNRGSAINYAGNTEYLNATPSGYESRLSNLLGCTLMTNNKRRTANDIDPSDPSERGYFHVLEHLLLRLPPFNKKIKETLDTQNILIELLSICADDDCTACGGEDPYSFTATIVLPAWIKVYEDIHYRDFIEKLIRRETPTTVLLRICWLDDNSMKAYEKQISLWWTAKQLLMNSDSLSYHDNAIQYIKAQNQFIQVIKKQRSEFPPATLHGCEDEGEENNARIFLDKTTLGNPLNKPLS